MSNGDDYAMKWNLSSRLIATSHKYHTENFPQALDHVALLSDCVCKNARDAGSLGGTHSVVINEH